MPVQKAITVALGDEKHVTEQKEIYRRRRDVLLPALIAYGFDVQDSEAGLYLWATKGQNCWSTIEELAQIGIVAVPGEFYGEAGSNFVRFSITATDKEISEAASRLQNALG